MPRSSCSLQNQFIKILLLLFLGELFAFFLTGFLANLANSGSFTILLPGHQVYISGQIP